MNDPASSTNDDSPASFSVRRAIVQKLESLHRGGVRSIPHARNVATADPATKVEQVVSDPPSQSGVAGPAPTEVGARNDVRKPPESIPLPSSPSVPDSVPDSVRQVPDLAGGKFASALLAPSEREGALRVLADEVAACTKCPELVAQRRQTVFGVGNPNSRLVFFGEAPGADEDRVGEPFVGKAGQLLTKIIEACKLKREDVYIMNVLRCRPPGNRNPTPEEASNCRPFFEKQFEVIRPEFVCCLGSIATSTLLETTLPVGRLRGKLHDWRGMKVAVTYHPAYLLRNPQAKRLVWEDMKMLMKEMGVEL